MSLDYQIKHITEQMSNFQREQEQLTHALMRTRREEQSELDRLRREYNTRINAIMRRQETISKELHNKERELDRVRRMVEQKKTT